MNEVNLGPGALIGVAVASIGAAALALLALRLWSDQKELKRAKARAQAHLLEFRLFMDDPVTILRSQRDLMSDNVRIMGLLLKPMLLASIPIILLMWQLDGLYGRAPLRTGEAAVVSWGGRADAIEAPDGIAVETKAVHILATGETCWRIRPRYPLSARLRIGMAETRIAAGGGVAYLPQRLIGRDRIAIGYPRATILGLHWIVWFLLLSAIAGFSLRRPMGATF